MERLNIKDIKTPFKSIRKVDPFKYVQLKKSVKKFGQLRPLIITPDLNLVDGYLLYRCLSDLKHEQVDIKKLVIDNVDEFRLSYNALSFELDQIQFLSILKNLEINSDNIFPYTNEELLTYKKLIQFDWEKYKTKISSKSIF